VKTLGWDTVFVADIREINQALAQNAGQYVETFRFEEHGFHIEGAFGAWEIVPGGAGDLLDLQITIATGTLSMEGLAQPIDLAGVKVVLTVSLRFLPAPGAPQTKVLTFHFDSVADHNVTAPGAGVVSFNKTIAPEGLLTPLQQTAVGMAIASALVHNAAQISFVFAAVNPLAATQAPWLQPHDMAYCYADVVGTGAQMLSILCVNSERPIGALPRQFDPGLFAPDQNAGLALSESLFLANVLIPALAATFQTSASNFRLGTVPGLSQQGVLLANPFRLPAVHKAGQTYRPSVHALAAVVEDTRVQLQLSGNCDMKMGIRMDFQASSTLGATFTPATGTLAFATLGPPVFHKQIHVPWYDHLFDIFGLVAELILDVTVAEQATGATLENSVFAVMCLNRRQYGGSGSRVSGLAVRDPDEPQSGVHSLVGEVSAAYDAGRRAVDVQRPPG
jgi:hypothetical protein